MGYGAFHSISRGISVLLLSLAVLSCSAEREKTEDSLQTRTDTAGGRQKVLYVNSYDAEYFWARGIFEGILSGFDIHTDEQGTLDFKNSPVDLKVFHMDTKRNPSEEYIKKSALEARDLIESWNPDLVICSDDNAVKSLLVPYYMDSSIPFVFCGVNWDASVYGFPVSNVTGMVEVSHVPELVEELKKYSGGDRIAFLKGDSFSSRKESFYIERLLDHESETVFVDSLARWKEEFVRLQEEVDILLLGNLSSLKDWDERDSSLRGFILDETKIPTGSWDIWMAETSLISFVSVAEEQGEWASYAALRILSGESPSDIPLSLNKKTGIYLSLDLAEKMDLKFSPGLIERAQLLRGEQGKRKILFVNSYHKGYVWSDAIERGFLKAFQTHHEDLEIRMVRMDTKNHNDEAFIMNASRDVRDLIEEWKPDIVAGSDDVFSKYVIVPYFINSEIPFVFCGVNWDASEYGFPVGNITGMVEVDPLKETLEILGQFAAGNTVGILMRNDLSSEKILKNIADRGEISIDRTVGVQTFREWKEGFLSLQESVDSLLLLNPIGIEGWDEDDAQQFLYEHTKIPTGISVSEQIQYALLGVTKVAEEQGWWTAKTVIRILKGTSPADIPLVTNRETRLFLNMDMAKHMEIIFPPDLMEDAILWNHTVNEEPQ
ncbi:MAG: ABC transporter substrate binding protein [Spirochaetales bacterium]|nr:ABC transporter substrate binding protein [Spirochaetales bacterium]